MTAAADCSHLVAPAPAVVRVAAERDWPVDRGSEREEAAAEREDRGWRWMAGLAGVAMAGVAMAGVELA